ncbi:hypothetical protein Dimus_000384 [Dionaea muscipula]
MSLVVMSLVEMSCKIHFGLNGYIMTTCKGLPYDSGRLSVNLVYILVKILVGIVGSTVRLQEILEQRSGVLLYIPTLHTTLPPLPRCSKAKEGKKFNKKKQSANHFVCGRV